MTDHLTIEALGQSRVLGGLAREELAQLAAMMRSRSYRRGEVVFHRDDPGEALHVVCRGHLKIVLPSASGAEAVLAIIGPGELFGELALLDGGPRSATVLALEPVETAALCRADFLELVERSPAVTARLLAALARIIRVANDMLGDLVFLDQPGRLAKKLLELAEVHGHPLDQQQVEIGLSLTQDELAAAIGASRTTVNRLLGLYEAQGIISLSRRRVVVRDPERLRRRATA
jgi:CRP/FNR family transcriptional regulator, cyclic AMP receptor protein